MVQIKCLGNGLYSLKNSHIPFGQGFQPPPPYGQRPFEPCFSCAGASLNPRYQLGTATGLKLRKLQRLHILHRLQRLHGLHRLHGLLRLHRLHKLHKLHILHKLQKLHQ